MRAAGIGVNVHYIPVHLHPYYQRHLGTGVGLCRVAEKAYDEILSLPMHAGMTGLDVDRVLQALTASLA
jgi:perosamine synthetase